MTSQFYVASRRSGLFMGLSALGLALGGCGPSGFSGPRGDVIAAPPAPPAATTPVQAPNGQTLGSGPVRIGLVAPLTQGGQPSGLGAALRNAAEMAVTETGQNDVTVLVKDDQSTPDGARTATQAALSEGAELILGPLFANGVREAGRVAKPAGKPVIGFSTDATAASPGVYLLSFLGETNTTRIVEFAAQKGKKSIAALIPETDYGNVVAAQFQTDAARLGLRVMAVERYNKGNLKAAAQRIAGLADQIDSLFLPDQAAEMPFVAKEVSGAGVDLKRVQVLGTGLWNDPRVLKTPQLQGAWFAAPENGGFAAFAQRYKAKYNAEPPRIASLAYDATTLAIALARAQGAQRYTAATLTNASGFSGADGVFRFKTDGTNDRGLSVLQISNGAASVISPAPRSFSSPPA